MQVQSLNLKQLKKMVEDASMSYHNEGKSELSDLQYDLLCDEIKRRDASWNEKVGSTPPKLHRVQLPIWLGSLDKVKPNNVGRWFKKKQNQKIVVSEKLDGVSCLIKFENLTNTFYTRGNGKIGTNITKIGNALGNIPLIETLPDQHFFVRGELVMKNTVFKKHYHSFSNPRNFVAGVINQKNPDLQAVEHIDFLAYEIVVPNGIQKKQSEQFASLEQFGFQTPRWRILDNEEKNPKKLSLLLAKSRSLSDYDIDGLVLVENSTYKRNKEKNPKYACAFKDNSLETLVRCTVESVEWKTSKHGKMKPRIKIRPVFINGVEVTFTNGFNAKYINDNRIGPGSLLELRRSGDVIPHIHSILKGTGGGMPSEKFSWCGHDIVSTSSKSKDERHISYIASFLSALNVDGLGYATVQQLYKAGFDSIVKLLNAPPTSLVKIPGFGKLRVAKLKDSIMRNVGTASNEDLISASNSFGEGIGKRKIKLIFSQIPNLLELEEQFIFERLLAIPGISKKTALSVTTHLDSTKTFLATINHCRKDWLVEVSFTDTPRVYNGVKIVLSGFRDKALMKKLEDEGVEFQSTVTRTTTCVVTTAANAGGVGALTSKLKKASDLNVDIIARENLELFLKKFKNIP